jgi:hypothetical protein
MKIVRVTWHDAFADVSGWCSVLEIDDAPCIVTSVGFLCEDAKPDHVTIAQSWNDHEHVDSVLHVPVAMVKSLQILC